MESFQTNYPSSYQHIKVLNLHFLLRFFLSQRASRIFSKYPALRRSNAISRKRMRLHFSIKPGHHTSSRHVPHNSYERFVRTLSILWWDVKITFKFHSAALQITWQQVSFCRSSTAATTTKCNSWWLNMRENCAILHSAFASIDHSMRYISSSSLPIHGIIKWRSEIEMGIIEERWVKWSR